MRVTRRMVLRFAPLVLVGCGGPAGAPSPRRRCWRRRERAAVASPSAALAARSPSRRRRSRSAQAIAASADPSPAPSPIAAPSGPGRWTQHTAVPTPRSELGGAAIGSRIYLVGGFGGSSAAVHEEYDAAADTWRSRAPIPIGRDHPGVAAAGGKLYVIGGSPAAGPDQRHGVRPRAPTPGAPCPPMPTPRSALGLAVVDGRIYAVGGVGPQATPARPRSSTRPPSSGARSRRCPRRATTWPSSPSAAACTPSAVGSATWRATWMSTRSTTPSPIAGRPGARCRPPRSGVAGAVLGERAYVFGGEEPSKTFSENEEYDPATDTWTARAPMPRGRHGLAAATVGDAIFVLAGGPRPAAPRSAPTRPSPSNSSCRPRNRSGSGQPADARSEESERRLVGRHASPGADARSMLGRLRSVAESVMDANSETTDGDGCAKQSRRVARRDPDATSSGSCASQARLSRRADVRGQSTAPAPTCQSRA